MGHDVISRLLRHLRFLSESGTVGSSPFRAMDVPCMLCFCMLNVCIFRLCGGPIHHPSSPTECVID